MGIYQIVHFSEKSWFVFTWILMAQHKFWKLRCFTSCFVRTRCDMNELCIFHLRPRVRVLHIFAHFKWSAGGQLHDFATTMMKYKISGEIPYLALWYYTNKGDTTQIKKIAYKFRTSGICVCVCVWIFAFKNKINHNYSKECLSFQYRSYTKRTTHVVLFRVWDILQGAVSIRKTVLPGMAIPMLKIRRPNGGLIFNMEITIRR